MKIEYTDIQQEFELKVKIFAEQIIKPNAAFIDKSEYIPKEVIGAMIDHGYLGSMIPKEYGGMGLDSISIGILNEIIGGACSSTRSLLTVHGMVSLAILRWGSEKQKKYLLPKLAKGEIIGAFALTEPDTGSDAKSIKTIATDYKNGYILNGTKKWITMGQIATIFLVFAKYKDKVTAFLLEKDNLGLVINHMGGLIGARGSMIAELNINNCKIPRDNIIGNPGIGLSHVALSSLDYGRFTIACGNVGLAQSCLEESIQYARKRKQFNEVICKHQLVQKMITEMIVDIEAGRLLCNKAGYLRDNKSPDSIMQVWIAKYYTSLMANRVANFALQIHGAKGCSDDYPLERYLRDSKVSEIIEGTTQIHEVMIAVNSLRKYL